MTNGDEVSLTCGEAASIVDRIRGFFEPSSILVSTLVLTLRPTGLLPLVTEYLANAFTAAGDHEWFACSQP